MKELPFNGSRLLLVDALNIAYRAFYAIVGLTTANGQPTNAIYGFIKTLMRCEREWNPTHCLVVFDGGTPVERLNLLPTYKAQRPAMPDALYEQLKPMEAYLDCSAIANLRIEGQEADDVIASVAAQAEDNGMEVLVMSGDKDFMQIVDENVSIISPGKRADKIGPAQVFEKTGVKPDQIVDWLALTGDTSDNIPGVPGVGIKTSARWLAEYGSVETILAHLQELKPEKLRQAIIEHKEKVIRNIRIIRLRRDFHCLNSLDEVKCRTPDYRRLLRFFNEMEFKSLAEDLRK